MPLYIAGPGIAAKTIIDLPVMTIDLAPTFLELGLVDSPPSEDYAIPDGTSLVSLLFNGQSSVAAGWRTTNFIEYYFVNDNAKCVENCSIPGTYPEAEAACADLSTMPNGDCWGTEKNMGETPATDMACNADCYITEDIRNNFIALRRPSDGLLYAEYKTGDQTDGNVEFSSPDFNELFNTTEDPWHVNNLYSSADPALIQELHDELLTWFACSGDSCRSS